jgi:outer membrane receptor protein involved in Fe transport
MESVMAQKATIVGKITDKTTGEPLIGASVYIEGTTNGTVADFDGNYTISNLTESSNPVNLVCSFISYKTSSVPNIKIESGKTYTFNFVLVESSIALNDVKVVAKAKRESEVVLLLDQKKSNIIKQTIGAQQLANQGISDAASAATKITGVTKSSGVKGLNIRGLGDRYNSSTLNGLPLPSNNAEFKNIDLDLFGTDIIEYIDVEKNYQSNLYGDFAGANINIVSKTHTGKSYSKIKAKAKYNTQLAETNKFYKIDGSDFLGFADTDYPTDFDAYDFKNSWNPRKTTAAPGMDLSFMHGNSFSLGENKLNMFASFGFENEYSYSEMKMKKVNGSDDIRKSLQGERYEYNTTTTALLNFDYSRSKSKYYLNSLFLNTSDNSIKNLNGYIIDLAEDNGLVRRSELEINRIFINQILGEHNLPKLNISWAVAYNNVLNKIPDRRHITMEKGEDDMRLFATNDQANNNRYFHKLKENEYAANLKLTYNLNQNNDSKSVISLGFSARNKSRDFSSVQFNHKIKQNELTDIWDIDSYFNHDNFLAGKFEHKILSENFIIESEYTGDLSIFAAFASLEHDFNDKLSMIFGIRYENIEQKASYDNILGADKEKISESKFLPALNLKYALNNKSNLRMAGGISYTLPQFKEAAFFLFEGITEVSIGNPKLNLSTNYNGEIKYEIFPNPDELVSMAAFAKYISDPINKFVRASAGNEYTYANTGDWAKIYGVEFEMKKNLFKINEGARSKKLYAAFNATLMHTNQSLDNDKIIKETNNSISANFNKDEESLQGAANILLNTSLNYQQRLNEISSLNLGINYSYKSDRINGIGYASLGNQIDKHESELNFVAKAKIRNIGIDLSIQNILNPDIDRSQENSNKTWIVQSYKKGVKIGLGLSYKF